MQKVLTLTQEEYLQTKERETTDRIPLIITFNPTSHLLERLLNEIGIFSNQKKGYRSCSRNHLWSPTDDRKVYETDLCIQDL